MHLDASSAARFSGRWWKNTGRPLRLLIEVEDAEEAEVEVGVEEEDEDSLY